MFSTKIKKKLKSEHERMWDDCNDGMQGVPILNLSSLTSTPIMRLAPALAQPMMTARPTAPRPHTATVDPSSTPAVFLAAP